MRFARNIMVFVGAILVSELFLFVLLPENPHSYYKAYARKLDRLRSLPSPKMVLVGGSNLAFGMDSSMLQRHIGMPVVNMGMNGGLGLDFMLKGVEPYLACGDVVVLAPEYPNFYHARYVMGLKTLCEFLFENKTQLRNVGWLQVMPLLKYMPVVIAERSMRVLRTIHRETFNLEDIPPEYRISSFDEYGDITNVLVTSGGHEKILGPLKEGDKPGPLAIALINRFAKRCRRSGIVVVLTYSVLRQSDYDACRQDYERLSNVLKSELSLTVLGSPQNYVFSDDAFYDTPDHLLYPAREKRTRCLIRQLKQVL